MPAGVRRHVGDRHPGQHRPDDQPEAETGEERQTGDRLPDADRERIEEGAGETGALPPQSDPLATYDYMPPLARGQP